MPDEGMILEFIDLIYQVAAEPTAWPRLLERIGSAVGEASISLITTENFEKPIDVWLARYDSACVELRLRYYARPEMNPVVRAATTIEPLCVVPCRQFLTDREFERDPACQATLIAQDLYHGCIAALHRTGPLLSALEVYRPRARDFAASELRMLGRLVPHMANALRVNWYVGASQTHQRQAEEALNQLNTGLFLLENDGRIVFANRTAQGLLRKGDGITARAGKLVATRQRDHAMFSEFIARAAGQATDINRVQAIRIERDAGRRPLQAWAAPLPRHPGNFLRQSSPSDLMLVVIDPELSAAPPIEALRALYGLTDAEARLTCALLEGARLEDYAERVGISMNTARTHLKSVFAKTDTDRQAELMRLLSRSLCSPN
jgi:DNA-binding CsgD family transcriptional regulator/PAS domain-containing protein